MKFLVSLVVLFASAASAADYTPTRQYVHPVIITTSYTLPHRVVGSGSAVMVAPGYALTAAHVVPLTDEYKMVIQTNLRQVAAIPVKIDRTKDLALLAVDLKCPCAPKATKLPSIDEQVVNVGFPLYGIYRIQLATQGTIQGFYSNAVVTTAATAPGGSGGGLFAKEGDAYRLVGITVAIASAPVGPRMMSIEQEYNWLAFGVPIGTIRKFLHNTPAQ